MEPRIALVDIETAPNLGWYFDPWRENNILDVKSDWYMLSFAAKWLGERKTTVYALPDYAAWKRDRTDDKQLLVALRTILDEADIVIGHNLDRFDIRKANARFLAQGLNPPSPYKTIDTLKIARRYFKFDSNRLNDLGRYLKIGRKIPHTGVNLWLGCMAGDEKSWRIMRRYNARDVDLLEDVYLKLRPWASNHPALNQWTRKHGDCPTCQSGHIQQRGWIFSKPGKRKRLQCQGCGAWFAGRELVKDASHRVSKAA